MGKILITLTLLALVGCGDANDDYQRPLCWVGSIAEGTCHECPVAGYEIVESTELTYSGEARYFCVERGVEPTVDDMCRDSSCQHVTLPPGAE